MPPSKRDPVLKELLRSLKRIFKKEPDELEDPYAYVGAPKKPRPPSRSSAAAVKPES